MEQFSLEKYLANPSRKVVTGDGRRVRVICTDMKSTTYPVVALIERCDNTEDIYTYSKDGKWNINEITTYDLFFAPEKHDGWVSIYRRVINDGYFTDGIFDSEEKAKERGGSIATVKVEWEE